MTSTVLLLNYGDIKLDKSTDTYLKLKTLTTTVLLLNYGGIKLDKSTDTY